MKTESNFMYFKELAAIFGVSTQTFRKMIKSNTNTSKLGSKRGTGTYFYNKEEIALLFNNFKNYD